MPHNPADRIQSAEQGHIDAVLVLIMATPCSAQLMPCVTLTCRYHALTLQLLKASWRRAQQLVASRADAIRKVAAGLLAADDEQVEGKQLVEMIEVGWGVWLVQLAKLYLHE